MQTGDSDSSHSPPVLPTQPSPPPLSPSTIARGKKWLKLKERSYAYLGKARGKFFPSRKKDPVKEREKLQARFTGVFGSPAHDWQLDVAEAMEVGVHTVLLAGTGLGKTIPFILTAMLDPKARVLVISPLNSLQIEQVRCTFS